MIERRSILKCLIGAIAAPAIIKVAGSMPVKASLQPSGWTYNSTLKLWERFEHQRIQMWRDSNLFLQNIDEQYREQFGRDGAKIGTQLRIRLPNDYVVARGDIQRDLGIVPDKLALATAAVAIVPTVLKTPVTRRFWSAKAA